MSPSMDPKRWCPMHTSDIGPPSNRSWWLVSSVASSKETPRLAQRQKRRRKRHECARLRHMRRSRRPSCRNRTNTQHMGYCHTVAELRVSLLPRKLRPMPPAVRWSPCSLPTASVGLHRHTRPGKDSSCRSPNRTWCKADSSTRSWRRAQAQGRRMWRQHSPQRRRPRTRPSAA